MIEYITDRNLRTFVAFDLETTGFGDRAAITEIGAVRVEYGEITERFDTLVDPGFPIPPEITALTGISDDMVRGMPAIHQALPRFLDFAGAMPLVAHNARFDCGFLQREMGRQGIFRTLSVADTLTLARRTWRRLPCYKLPYLADYFVIAQSQAHRAWCDAEVAAKLYLMMRED